jgi:hypothetical protein
MPIFHLSDIPPESQSVSKFVLVDLKIIFDIYYTGTFMIDLLVKFKLPAFCGPLVIAVELRAKENLCTTDMLF